MEDDDGMPGVAVNDRDLYGDSCVVRDWLTHDDDAHSGADEMADVISVNPPTVMTKSSLLQTSKLTVAVTESPVKQEILNTAPYWHTVPSSLDFTSLIVDLVHQYAAQVSPSLCFVSPLCLYCLNIVGRCQKGDQSSPKLFAHFHTKEWPKVKILNDSLPPCSPCLRQTALCSKHMILSVSHSPQFVLSLLAAKITLINQQFATV